jgi:hypothetical protein
LTHTGVNEFIVTFMCRSKCCTERGTFVTLFQILLFIVMTVDCMICNNYYAFIPPLLWGYRCVFVCPSIIK